MITKTMTLTGATGVLAMSAHSWSNQAAVVARRERTVVAGLRGVALPPFGYAVNDGITADAPTFELVRPGGADG